MNDDELSKILCWATIGPNTWTSASNLYRSLMHSARHHAGVALRDFTEEDGNAMADAGLHAGIAVEHLAKCYLSSIHPILLAEKGCDVDTLLHLSGKSDIARTSPYCARTVNGVDACKRAAFFLSGFRFNDQADGILFTVRNSVIHLGVLDEIRKPIRAMIRLADPLLAGLDYKRSAFWGSYLSIVDLLRDEEADELQTVLSIKFKNARRRLEVLLSGLEGSNRTTFKAIQSARGPRSKGDYEAPFPCPVCGSQGFLICHREWDAVYKDAKQDEYAIIFNEPVAYPTAFECRVCDLELNETDLETAGMPLQIDLPESDSVEAD